MKNFTQKALAVGILAISSSFASAANFTFTESAGFVIGDVNSPSDVMVYGSPLVDPNAPSASVTQTIEWYERNAEDDRSMLELSNPDQPVAWDPLDWVTITTLTHTNNDIAGYTQGWTGQNILGRLIISDEGGVVLDDEDAITIDLTETTNTAPCATDHTGSAPCEDFFTFTAVGLADLFFTASDNTQWKVMFQLANFNNSFFDGINTVFTSEFEVSSLDVQMKLVSVDVPEPATLGIFGLGLLGLGLTKRRKQNA